MSNVVGLKGSVLSPDRPPDPAVIEKLEWLLEAAQSGEVMGVAAAYVFRDSATGTISVGFANYAQVGRLHALAASTLAQLEDNT